MASFNGPCAARRMVNSSLKNRPSPSIAHMGHIGNLGRGAANGDKGGTPLPVGGVVM